MRAPGVMAIGHLSAFPEDQAMVLAMANLPVRNSSGSRPFSRLLADAP